ncbi:ABC multidrug transporter [Apiospora phragmitis]|uniref:ABC multidrug transporter n=1 Tax=Apiospora phragmitis TaxID=2905665 RepID=A0ABR1VCB8_9PEZI
MDVVLPTVTFGTVLYLEAKSPLYTYFTEILEGLTTIRDFQWQAHSINVNLKCLDNSQKPYYLMFCI